MNSPEELQDLLAQLRTCPGALQDATASDVNWYPRVAEVPGTAQEQQAWSQRMLDILSRHIKQIMKEVIGTPQLNLHAELPCDVQLRMYFEDRSTDCYREFVRILKIALDRISPQIVTNAPIPIPGLQHKDLLAALRSVRDRAEQLRADNPRLAQAGGVALLVGGGVVIVPAASAALLLAAGFGPLGPVAGTLAPLLQSVFYGAQTGGLFSMLQAAGMTMVAPSAVATTLASAAAGVGAWFGFGSRRGGAQGGAATGPGGPPSDEDGGPPSSADGKSSA